MWKNKAHDKALGAGGTVYLCLCSQIDSKSDPIPMSQLWQWWITKSIIRALQGKWSKCITIWLMNERKYMLMWKGGQTRCHESIFSTVVMNVCPFIISHHLRGLRSTNIHSWKCGSIGGVFPSFSYDGCQSGLITSCKLMKSLRKRVRENFVVIYLFDSMREHHIILEKEKERNHKKKTSFEWESDRTWLRLWTQRDSIKGDLRTRRCLVQVINFWMTRKFLNFTTTLVRSLPSKKKLVYPKISIVIFSVCV